MNIRSISCIATIAVIASFAAGCKGSDSDGSSDAAPAATEQTPTAGRTASAGGSSNSTVASGATTPASLTSEKSTAAGCPGDLANDAVFESYRAIGIKFEIDCDGMRRSNYFYQYRLSDIGDTLKVLESNLDLFKHWPQRPAKIVIGDRAFHSSKKNLIQVPYITSRPQELEDYLRDTRLLMDLEITEFNRSVRFSYVSYELARQASGEKTDVGTGGLVGYGAAREQIVKDDIARVLKLKKSIQQMPFKNVRLTHANQMGSFIVSQWSDSYTLPTEYTDAQLAPYFKYLTKLANVQKSFGDTEVSVIVPAYPQLEIKRAAQSLDVLAAAKKTIEKIGVKSVHVSDVNISEMLRRFRVSKRNGGLTIDNLYDSDGTFHTAAQLEACLEKADFETTATYFCDGRGPLKY